MICINLFSSYPCAEQPLMPSEDSGCPVGRTAADESGGQRLMSNHDSGCPRSRPARIGEEARAVRRRNTAVLRVDSAVLLIDYVYAMPPLPAYP